MERGRYKTRQRALVEECLTQHAGEYLSVDDVVTLIAGSGNRVGRTTVYRALETMEADGLVLKAVLPGGEASYRLAEEGAAGQLVCIGCGRTQTLDCREAARFASHVLEGHGFAAEAARTVLYGKCGSCMKKEGDIS